MKALIFLWFFLSGIYFAEAQELAEFSKQDYTILGIPDEQTNTTNRIADFIKFHFSTDEERFRAAYVWVTSNIKYDSDSMYAINWGKDPEAKITIPLKRRKGVCENFAAIFNDIAVKSGLTSFVINGYTRQAGAVNRSGHSWCAVLLNNQWLLCDPTWDAGFRQATNYFLVSPEKFIESHMPFDPLWQLLNYPVSHSAFYKGYNEERKEKKIYDFSDSIKVFTQLSELEQLRVSLFRIRQAGIANDLIKNRVAYLEMLISIIYEEEDMNLYNGAVADLNIAMKIFNEFIQYRNNQFQPAKTDEEIKAILTPADAALASAYKKTDKIGKASVNLQYDTGSLQNRLQQLTDRIEEQREFLTRYFATELTQRHKIFYR